MDPNKIPQSTLLLRACACLELDEQRVHQINKLVANRKVWQGLAQRAERHGMAPLLYHHLKQLNVAIPDRTALQLKSLVLRHQRATKIRTKELMEVLQTLATNDIPVIVLKGAALAYALYPTPELRPMSDIDILVDEHKCQHAQRLLTSLGYGGANMYRPGAKFDHHHMAIAKKHIDGLTISVEVHRDALSPDAIGSLTIDSLSSLPTAYTIENIQARHFGHIDMLLHLCRHLTEPADETRLISIVDVYAFAEKYFVEIDWRNIKGQHSFIHNALRCLHAVSPLPVKLQPVLSPPENPATAIAGFGVPTLSSVSWNATRPRQNLRRIFLILHPPQWWLHLYYNVEPERKSVLTIRWIEHPLRIIYWLALRVRALVRYHFYRITHRLQN